MVRFFLKCLYRVELRGRDNYAAVGDRVFILNNPGSILDPLIIAAVLPRRITLLADSALRNKWWMRPVKALADIVFLDFSSPTATAAMTRVLRERKCCMVFLSEYLNNTPRLTRILEAASIIACHAGAELLPVIIDGPANSVFSYLRHRARRRLFVRARVSVLPPHKLSFLEGLSPRERRTAMGAKLYSLALELNYRSSLAKGNVLTLLMETAGRSGRKFPIAEDQDRNVLTYGALLTKVCVLGHAFGRIFKGEERVGFLLPTSLAGLVAFFGLHAGGRVPAMLNFTSGIASVLSCCGTIQIRSVLTARKFLKMANLEELEQALKDAGLRMIYLEDVAGELTLSDKVAGLTMARRRKAPRTPGSEPVAVLFTSGTEGVPKAVFLSHDNVVANLHQALTMFTVGAGDKLFNCLPMFHAFGLGICTLLPVLAGIRVFLYPSPLHYRIVPQLFYESQSTIICGTDTFCAGYARYGRPFDFCHARLVIIGAEKMRDSTREDWKRKYGVDPVEGYGATETSPLISVNSPAYTRRSSVGRMVPGLQWRLQPVPGIEEENTGVLWVKGDNVMLGYMRSTAPGELEPPMDDSLLSEDSEDNSDAMGWYDTGDIVHIDGEGFIFIRGRAKRFAKIGGEMVSLAAVEDALREIWPEAGLGVVAVPDPRKGEQIALVIAAEDASTSRIAAHFASRGISPLWTPKRIVCVKQAPLLGSGKFDYVEARKLILEQSA